MTYGISQADLDEIICEIKNNLGNSKNPKLYIYGSRVKGNAREFSDIDLLLKANSYDEITLGKIDFSGLNTPYKVDFVLEKDLFENYREEIFSHMKELEL